MTRWPFLTILVFVIGLVGLVSFTATRSYAANCSNPAAPESTILYNSTEALLQYCDGAAWTAIGTLEGTGGACVNPAASEGAIAYNVDNKVPQYCSGIWIALGEPLNEPGGDGTCANPAAPGGTLLYNDDFKELQYCDGEVWKVVPRLSDKTPASFAFTDQTDVDVNTTITSDTETITGITGNVSVSISGDGSPEFRIDGGSWTSGPATIQNNQTLQLRMTSNGSFNTTNSATVTVGTDSDQWDVTTVALTISYVPAALTHTLSTSITIPSDARAGDLAILVNGAGSTFSLPPDKPTPSGWTMLADGALNFMRSKVFYKVLTPGDINATITNLLDGGAAEYARLVVFRPSYPFDSVTPTLVATRETVGDPAAIPVSTVGKPEPTLVFMLASSAVNFGTVDISGTSGSLTVTDTFDDYSRTAYEIFNSSASYGVTVDMADTANDNQLHGMYFEFTF